MADINLLPTEFKPKGSILKLSKTLRKLILAGFAIFVFGAILSAGAFLIVSSRLKASLSRQEELKSQIKAYQQTEQNLLLTKDRLSKVDLIYSIDSAKEETLILDEILGRLPGQVLLKEVELSFPEAKITVIVPSSSELTSFLRSIRERTYKKVELTSFIFRESIGYEVKVALAR